MRNRNHWGMLAATVATFVVTGCGGSADSTEPKIATLRSAEATVSSTAAAQERPLIRADATAEEINALNQAHFRCLEAEGAPVAKSSDGEYGKPTGSAWQDERWGPAAKACASTEPQSWLDRERSTNPEFADRLREAVKCLRDKGFEARLDGDPPQIMYSDTAEYLRADKAQNDCQNAAFSNRIKELYSRD